MDKDSFLEKVNNLILDWDHVLSLIPLKHFENTIPTDQLLTTIVNQNRSLCNGISGPHKKIVTTPKEIKLDGESVVKLILHIQNSYASPTNKTAFAVL